VPGQHMWIDSKFRCITYGKLVIMSGGLATAVDVLGLSRGKNTETI
jgi:hypothetical protein